MKKVILITFFSCFFFAGIAQTVLEQKVDFYAQDLPLKAAIFQLSEQLNTGFTFSGLIIPDKTITVSFEKQSLNHILTHIFEGTAIQWRLEERQIVLSKTAIKKFFYHKWLY